MIHLRNFAVYIVIEASETSTNLEGSPMVFFTAMMQTYRNIQHFTMYSTTLYMQVDLSDHIQQ